MTSPRYASAWGESEEAAPGRTGEPQSASLSAGQPGISGPGKADPSPVPAVTLNAAPVAAPTLGGASPFCDALNAALERSRLAHPQAKFRGWPWFANKVLNAHPSAITRMRGGHATLASLDLIARKLKWRVTIHIEGE